MVDRLSPGAPKAKHPSACNRFMNDERSVSAVGGSQALASEPELAPVAVPPRRTERPAADDPLALSHRDKRLIAISMMLTFLGTLRIINRTVSFRHCAENDDEK